MLPALAPKRKPTQGQAPRRSVSGKGTLEKSTARPSPTAPGAPGPPPASLLTKEMPLRVAMAIGYDEQLERGRLEADMSVAATFLWVQHQHAERQWGARQVDRVLGATERISEDQTEDREAIESLDKTVGTLAVTTRGIAEQLQTMSDKTNDELRRKVETDLENKELRGKVAQLESELELLTASLDTMKSALQQRIVRSMEQDEVLREELRAEIRRVANVPDLTTALHTKIESAVLNFHSSGNIFDSALMNVREVAEETRSRVERRSQELHAIVDKMGNEEARSARSMHSNLSPVLKKRLQKMSRDQLLNLIDVLSFEPGALESISRALLAVKNPTNTQSVFD